MLGFSVLLSGLFPLWHSIFEVCIFRIDYGLAISEPGLLRALNQFHDEHFVALVVVCIVYQAVGLVDCPFTFNFTFEVILVVQVTSSEFCLHNSVLLTVFPMSSNEL